MFKAVIPIYFASFIGISTNAILSSLIGLPLLVCLQTIGPSRCQYVISEEGNNNNNSTDLMLRIVGGEHTDITNHPYQVQLEYRGLQECGGSIVSPNLVLTASHCVDGKSEKLLRIRAGTSYRGSEGSIHGVFEYYMHTQFDSQTFDFDIALIKVTNPFVYSNSVRPISLTSEEPSGNTVVTATGWGQLKENGPSPRVLRRVELYIIDRKECNRRYMQGNRPITQSMICAGVPGGGKDVCDGDSGGPLVADGKLVGITSWSKDCADSFFPSVYSNVALLQSWITSRIERMKSNN